MRYAIISVSGDLTHHDDHLDWDRVIGEEGKARVYLPGAKAAGWVNDCGLLFPERFPRNPVGSCVLAALRARVQPYAGPVVFTGWNPGSVQLGRTSPGIEPLPEPAFLDIVHGDVLKALDGQTPRQMSPSWAEQMREVAEHARTAPVPGITIRPVTLR